MNRLHRIVLTALLATACLAPSVLAGPASEIVEQAFKLILKKAARETAEEILQRGGSVVVREALERAAREGGQELAERTAREIIEHGIPAAHALRKGPGQVARLLDNTPTHLRKAAVHTLAHQGDDVLKLVAKHGDETFEQIIRHPGVGQKIVHQFGREGATVLRKCDEDLAIRLARRSDDIAKLSPDARKAVLESIEHAPDKALAWLERHPRILASATTLVAVHQLRDHVFGNPETNPPGGFVGRVVDAAQNLLAWPVLIVSSFVALALAVVIYRRFAPRRQPITVVSKQPPNPPVFEDPMP